ncbi:hypothetical protein M0R36_03985 [bacterium]|nr:hypothetical protein [bacterium]
MKKQKTKHQNRKAAVATPALKLALFRNLLIKSLSNGECISPTEVAMRVYNCKNRHVASVIASQNLIKLDYTVNSLLEHMGITDEADIELLKKLRVAEKYEKGVGMVPDNSIRLAALKLTQLLKGRLSSKEESGEGVQIIINILFEQTKNAELVDAKTK